VPTPLRFIRSTKTEIRNKSKILKLVLSKAQMAYPQVRAQQASPD
jgi:hypothetical protein